MIPKREQVWYHFASTIADTKVLAKVFCYGLVGCDRFGIILHLSFYNTSELSSIITRSADILGIDIELSGAEEIARRSRGTPRIANRLLRRVRDFAEVHGNGIINKELA